MKKFNMADFKCYLRNGTVRDRAKRTEIWDHMGKKSQILIILKTSFQRLKSEDPRGSPAQIFYFALKTDPKV